MSGLETIVTRRDQKEGLGNCIIFLIGAKVPFHVYHLAYQQSWFGVFLFSDDTVTEPTSTVDEPFVMLSKHDDSVAAGCSEIKIGAVTVQLRQGDLATENTDAIVNTVGKDLALKGMSFVSCKSRQLIAYSPCSQ